MLLPRLMELKCSKLHHNVVETKHVIVMGLATRVRR